MQLDDLGRQVQNLLREIGRRDDPTLPVDEDLENVDSVVLSDDVDSMITNNLVLFKLINGLQEQNMKLIKVVRELGARLENGEKEFRVGLERERAEAVQEAHEMLVELRSQLDRQEKSSAAIIQSYVKERDALKSVIARLEAEGPSHSRINGNISGSSPNVSHDVEEIQNQFETYRSEMGLDSVRLGEDLVVAQKEVAKLQADVAKEKARTDYCNGEDAPSPYCSDLIQTLSTERIRISQDEYNLRAQDLEDANKRNQQLFDQWTRAEIECNRLSEDISTANGRIEQLRNECANLGAEKRIWEGVQTRLLDENKTLSLERSHPTDMMTNI